jgi:hypothetical protein
MYVRKSSRCSRIPVAPLSGPAPAHGGLQAGADQAPPQDRGVEGRRGSGEGDGGKPRRQHLPSVTTGVRPPRLPWRARRSGVPPGGRAPGCVLVGGCRVRLCALPARVCWTDRTASRPAPASHGATPPRGSTPGPEAASSPANTAAPTSRCTRHPVRRVGSYAARRSSRAGGMATTQRGSHGRRAARSAREVAVEVGRLPGPAGAADLRTYERLTSASAPLPTISWWSTTSTGLAGS